MKTKNISLSEEEARQMYPDASAKLREKLVATFGIESLSTDIRDIVKTYEDACRLTGDTPIDEEKLKAAGFTPAEIALRQIETITKALNQGVVMSWEDENQQKWFQWFRVSPSGFSFNVTRYRYASPCAGSPPAFASFQTKSRPTPASNLLNCIKSQSFNFQPLQL